MRRAALVVPVLDGEASAVGAGGVVVADSPPQAGQAQKGARARRASGEQIEWEQAWGPPCVGAGGWGPGCRRSRAAGGGAADKAVAEWSPEWAPERSIERAPEWSIERSIKRARQAYPLNLPNTIRNVRRAHSAHRGGGDAIKLPTGLRRCRRNRAAPESAAQRGSMQRTTERTGVCPPLSYEPQRAPSG